MAELSGVKIERGKIGINQFGSQDAISGLIISSAGVQELAFATPRTIVSLADAQDLGITQDFDTTNNINVFRHISEFFRIAGEGTELHLMLVPQSKTMPQILQTDAKQLLSFAEGEIRNLAIAINPIADVTLVNGLPSEVFESIAKAQVLYQWADNLHMPCQIFLEGFSVADNLLNLTNLRALENASANKVSLMIGQDFNYAKTKQTNSQKYADVGTVLGLSAKAIHKIEVSMGDEKIGLSFKINAKC